MNEFFNQNVLISEKPLLSGAAFLSHLSNPLAGVSSTLSIISVFQAALYLAAKDRDALHACHDRQYIAVGRFWYFL